MNKFLLLISFTFIITLHILASEMLIKKESPIKQNKPEYQKISLQLSQLEQTKTLEKKIVKKKRIKKKKIEAKKKVKIPKKKPIKKLLSKKTEVKKVLKKKNLSAKTKTQFLEKTKKFKKTYLIQLRAAIDKNKKYPRVSKRIGEQGSVILSFKVLKNGLFENIEILSSSGRKRLDKAALKALKLTNSFKPFPKEIKEKFLNLSIPIDFRLK